MRKILFALSLCLVPLLAEAETISFSSAAFKSVEYSVDSRTARIWFRDVVIGESLRDVEAMAEAVSVELRSDLKFGAFIITTLDIFNVPANETYDLWLRPEKVVVIVRDKYDLLMWKKFLVNVKKKQEKKRKETLDPIRVYPPPINS